MRRHIFSGAAFTNNLGRSILLTEDRTGLVGEYMFGRDAATTIINGADPDNPLTVNGTPTYGDHVVTLSQNNWLDTNIFDDEDMTLIVACDGVEATGTGSGFMPIGNFIGTNTTDTTSILRNGSANILAQSAASDNTAQNTTATASTAPRADFRIMALRTSGSSNYLLEMDEFKGGANTINLQNATSKTRKVNTAYPFAIGSARGTTGAGVYYGAANYLAALIYRERRLTDAELVAVEAELRAVLTGFGKTV